MWGANRNGASFSAIVDGEEKCSSSSIISVRVSSVRWVRAGEPESREGFKRDGELGAMLKALTKLAIGMVSLSFPSGEVNPIDASSSTDVGFSKGESIEVFVTFASSFSSSKPAKSSSKEVALTSVVLEESSVAVESDDDTD